MTRCIYGVAFAVFVGLLAEASASAQKLQGVSETKITVETLDEDAARCNVTTSGLDASVRLPIANTALRLRDDAAGSFIYVNANVLMLSGGLCVASVELSFRRLVQIPSTQTFRNGDVWTEGNLMTGSPSDFGIRVNQSIEQRTKELIAQWLKDNPR